MQVFCRAKHKQNKGFDYTELRERGGELCFCPAPDMPDYVGGMFDLAIGVKIYCALFTDGEARLNLAVFGVGFSGSNIIWCSGDDVWMLNLIFRAENESDTSAMLDMMSAFMTDFGTMGNKLIECFSRTSGEVEYALDTSAYEWFWSDLPDVLTDVGEVEPSTMYCLYTPERHTPEECAQLPAEIANRYGLKCRKDAVYLTIGSESADDIIKNAFAPRKTNPLMKFLSPLFGGT